MKNLLMVYIAQIGLSIVFLVISALIVVFGAKPGLIKQKLKLGSMLIAVNAMLAGCFHSTDSKGTKGSNEQSTDTRFNSTDIVECYVAPYREDTESETQSDSDVIDTDVMCYEAPVPDSDSETATPDTGYVFETDDIECYDPVIPDSESETETSPPDAGPDSENEERDTDDVECYVLV